tara:strand:+ start:1168 stop:1887 length:720 start_codon:yes stop_codon:yes gene_type:complete
MPISLEIPIEDVDTARRVAPYVERIEVCDELASDGWSPSAETLEAIVRATAAHSVQVVALIRPRSCPDFIVSTEAVRQARADIEAASRAGVDGVVVGFLDRRNHLDFESLQELSELARSLDLSSSLHRVFDFDEDHEGALQMATQCGLERVLTSGAPGWEAASSSPEARVDRIRKNVRSSILHASDANRPPVRIVACGGVRASNASLYLEATSDLHASCRRGNRFDSSSFIGLLKILGR